MFLLIKLDEITKHTEDVNLCGIIGIVGKKSVQHSIIESLEKLEYRGYDSAGIATVSGDLIIQKRAVGKLSFLKDLLEKDPIEGKTGIGHTRWATHGAPSLQNAHPHKVGKVALVHNGIIENFHELRSQLISEGQTFVSDTDTEVIASLCSKLLEGGMSPDEAVVITLNSLEGAFA